MNKLRISDDIIPVGEFKTSISKYLKSLNDTGHPVIITQNGRPAGVLLSPSEYDNLIYKKEFIQSVNQGLKDVEAGNLISTQDLKKELQKMRSSRDKS